MEDYMEMAKTLKGEGLEGRQEQWSQGWYAGFKGELKNEAGKPVEVFGTFLSSDKFTANLKPNAGNTAGDWGMIAGPASYRWGGEWLCAYKGTKVPKLAKEFVKFVTADDEFLKKWVKSTGTSGTVINNIVANTNVINAIKDTYTEPFLNGQNSYAEFAALAQNVNGALPQATDQSIEQFWGEAVGSFVNGEKSKADAIADFKRHIKDELGY